jgi:hypothetical protein
LATSQKEKGAMIFVSATSLGVDCQIQATATGFGNPVGADGRNEN